MLSLGIVLFHLRGGIEFASIHIDERDIDGLRRDLDYLDRKLDILQDTLDKGMLDKTFTVFEAATGFKPKRESWFKRICNWLKWKR